MKFSAISVFFFGAIARVLCDMIPAGSPDGFYTFALNSTGHREMTYHGTTLPNTGKATELSVREHFSRRAAMNSMAKSLEKRSQVSCTVYTGLDYWPAANEMANGCGDDRWWYGSLAWNSNGG